MKKLLLLIVITFISISAQSQNITGASKPYYAFLQYTFTVVAPIVEMPQGKVKLLDENGEKLRFQTDAEMLTYFSKRGWEYVDRTLTPDHLGKYLLRKLVKNDEDVKSGLNIKGEEPERNKNE